jgi:hypothetical protein
MSKQVFSTSQQNVINAFFEMRNAKESFDNCIDEIEYKVKGFADSIVRAKAYEAAGQQLGQVASSLSGDLIVGMANMQLQYLPMYAANHAAAQAKYEVFASFLRDTERAEVEAYIAKFV